MWLSKVKDICPVHNDAELIHTVLPNGETSDYYPKCQELFGEKM
jgi:hypothetical protein